MEVSRRKFKADISNRSIEALLNKRQRKRFVPKKGPYDDRQNTSTRALVDGAMVGKDGQTVIRGIPQEMLPKNRQYNPIEPIRREYEKPEHWIQPKEEVVRSRSEVYEAERANIAKKVANELPWSRAAQILDKAQREPLRVSASNLTAKGYISSRRMDDGDTSDSK